MPGSTHPNTRSDDAEPPDSITVTLIAAIAENGVIGDSGEIPWYYPEDMAHFKEVTTGHPVIMGRKTFENIRSRIGGPLPNRTTIVLSRQADIDTEDSVKHAQDLEEAYSKASENAEEREVENVYVAGGGSVYEATLPHAERLVLTEIDHPYPGDVKFPVLEGEWETIEEEPHDDFTFKTYRRIS